MNNVIRNFYIFLSLGIFLHSCRTDDRDFDTSNAVATNLDLAKSNQNLSYTKKYMNMFPFKFSAQDRNMHSDEMYIGDLPTPKNSSNFKFTIETSPDIPAGTPYKINLTVPATAEGMIFKKSKSDKVHIVYFKEGENFFIKGKDYSNFKTQESQSSSENTPVQSVVSSSQNNSGAKNPQNTSSSDTDYSDLFGKQASGAAPIKSKDFTGEIEGRFEHETIFDPDTGDLCTQIMVFGGHATEQEAQGSSDAYFGSSNPSEISTSKDWEDRDAISDQSEYCQKMSEFGNYPEIHGHWILRQHQMFEGRADSSLKNYETVVQGEPVCMERTVTLEACMDIEARCSALSLGDAGSGAVWIPEDAPYNRQGEAYCFVCADDGGYINYPISSTRGPSCVYQISSSNPIAF